MKAPALNRPLLVKNIVAMPPPPLWREAAALDFPLDEIVTVMNAKVARDGLSSFSKTALAINPATAPPTLLTWNAARKAAKADDGDAMRCRHQCARPARRLGAVVEQLSCRRPSRTRTRYRRVTSVQTDFTGSSSTQLEQMNLLDCKTRLHVQVDCQWTVLA